MVAVSSLGFSVYEQYTSNTYADGSTTQSGSLQAGLTVGTDDGSSYGSAIVLDVKQQPASQSLKAGLRAVNTLTQVANQQRTQAPKDQAAGRLARAIQELRALNLVGGGIRAVQEAVRIAQDIASAVRDLAQAEEAIAEDGGSSGGADGASIGAAEAAAASAAAATAGPTAPSGDTAASGQASAASSADPTADPSSQTVPAVVEAGYSSKVGSALTGLIAGQAGLGTGATADAKVTSGLAKTLIEQLQSTGLPVDGSNLVTALNDLIANPLLGAQELQESAKQAGLNVTVATSLQVQNTLTDPRSTAASGVSAAAAAATINDPYDELIHDAVAALSAIGKGLKKALPPLLNSPDKKTAHEARKAQDQFSQAVADTVKSIGDYYTAKAEIEAEGGSDGTPSPATKAAIDAADAVINGPNAVNDQGGTVGDDAGVGYDGAAVGDTSVGDPSAGDAPVGDDGAAEIAPGSVAGTSIGIKVSVNIQV
jgi:fructose-specific phosphotransferase system component IIB